MLVSGINHTRLSEALMGQGLAGGQNNSKKIKKALDKSIDNCYISYVENEEEIDYG